jgi:hypothetical protein
MTPSTRYATFLLRIQRAGWYSIKDDGGNENASVDRECVSGSLDSGSHAVLTVAARGYHLLPKPVQPMTLRARVSQLLKSEDGARGHPMRVVAEVK